MTESKQQEKNIPINTSSNQLIENLISTYTTTYIMKLLNNKQQFNAQNIGYMLFVFSINEIKDFIKIIYTEVKQNIYISKDPFLNLIQSSFYFVYKKINYIFYKRIRHEPEIIITKEPKPQIYNNIINVNLPVNILSMLINYQKNKNPNSVKINKNASIKYLNLTDYEETIILEDFCLEIDDLGKIVFPSTLQLKQKYTNKSNSLISMTTTDNIISNDILDLFELISNKELGNTLRCAYKKAIEDPHYQLNFKGMSNVGNNENFDDHVTSQYRNVSIFFRKYFNKISTCDILNQYVFLTYLRRTTIENDSRLITGHNIYNGYLSMDNLFKIKLLNKPIELNNINNCYTYINPHDYTFQYHDIFLKHINNNNPVGSKYNINKLNDLIDINVVDEITGQLSQINMSDKTADKKINTNLELIIYPKNESINCLEELNKFISNIVKKNQKTKLTANTIYIIKLEKIIKTKMVPNPGYVNYQEKLEVLKTLINNTKQPDTTKNSTLIEKYILENKIPEKEIKEEHIETKIIKKEINKFKKPIDTLYLRKNDKTRLLNVLKTYLNKDTVLSEFGIPHKLGILASGLPGTGKSTMVQAIATYLNLDVYYLDLNGITKNSELKYMFDFVQKEQIVKGMIIFEDIDAMTLIVHKRSGESYEQINLTNMKEDDLSLSYLLNLLDGTLCSKDNVYMITTNYLDKLDPALYRTGRIDFNIICKLCDHYQIKTIFKKIIKTDIDKNILALIEEDKFTPADIIFHLLQYIYDKDNITQKEILKPFINEVI